jgi:hypothetical protein
MLQDRAKLRVMTTLPIEEILNAGAPPSGQPIGRSREGRELYGYRFGQGKLKASLIAGCHADEPVGPAMLGRLVAWLASRPANDPLLAQWSFRIVPHANPDGEARNAAWAGDRAARREPGVYDLAAYLQKVVRELPGDDIEFGFPRSPDDEEARPENRSIAAFLAPGAPYALHGSFHGMGFAAGPSFLMEAGWAGRTQAMRDDLRRKVAQMGYELHDVDRGGDKGFHRIDQGFTTRPDSQAMIAHFEALGDPATAALFRPSSMEYVRSLGGDPLTIVSEMPLFLLPARHYQEDKVRPPAIFELRRVAEDPVNLRSAQARHGVAAMPIRHQMELQLAYLDETLGAALGQKTHEGTKL